MPSYADPLNWTSGQNVSAPELQVLNDDIIHIHQWLGELGYNERTTDLGVANSPTVTTICTAAATVPAGGRNVKITARSYVSSTIDGDICRATLLMDSTTLVEYDFSVFHNTAPPLEGPTLVVRQSAPSAAAHNYILKLSRVNGTGTLTMRGDPIFPSFVLVEGL